ncbi:hypothetical protein DIPPA_57443 [Diplonema papillatum]|nr:hypothetical protein DIPPA_57443 [Diplonema papillatum]
MPQTKKETVSNAQASADTAVNGVDTLVCCLQSGLRTSAGESALIVASAAGSATDVSRLLSQGVGVDYLDDQGMTALDHAIRHHRADCVRLLREAGAGEPPIRNGAAPPPSKSRSPSEIVNSPPAGGVNAGVKKCGSDGADFPQDQHEFACI